MSREQYEALQSDWLVILMAASLVVLLGLQMFVIVGMSGPPAWFVWSAASSAAFALLVWLMRSATAGAAAMGGLICLSLLTRQMTEEPWTSSALPELLVLFATTFAATRFRRRRKEAMGLAEQRRGRRASQVAANLGVAGLVATFRNHPLLAASLAALAEATADTVASELGQVFEGPVYLITTLERVEPGTDGGISLAGTLLGAAGAAVIALTAIALHAIAPRTGWIVFLAGCAGLLFDSVLGATIERRGWIGNDLVNLASTALAAWIALEAAGLLGPPVAFW